MGKTEQWKVIEGYEGLYEVSSFGRVKSLERHIHHGSYAYKRKERMLKQFSDRDGYLRVNLSKEKKGKTVLVHRLVANAFIENKEKLPLVNHKDFNRTNNAVENLEWCSDKYNVQYSLHRRPVVQAGRRIGITNEKYIVFDGTYRADIRLKGMRFRKRFKTLDEAICYRNEVLHEIGISI